MAGWALFGPVIAELHRRGRRVIVSTVIAAVGLASVLGQMIVDIVVGWAAADRNQMHELFAWAYRIPGVQFLLYGVGPVLLIAGLAALFVQVAVQRRIRPGTAVLAVAGMLLMAVDTAVGSAARLIVMPVGVLCLWLSFDALRRDRDAH